MRLKTFIAPTVAEAMARVRLELGDDAVIVATEKPARGAARIVAAIEPAEAPPPRSDAAPAARPDPAPVGGDAILAALVRHGVPEALRARLVAAAGGDEAALAHALAGTLQFANLARRRGNAPIVLLGPHGAGKTSTAGKLAALGRLDGRAVRLISCDTWRAAGADQLGTYAAALGARFDIAADAGALAALLPVTAASDERALTIIDTPGLDPFAASDRAVGGELVRAAAGDAVLVLPAGLDPAESAELALAFAGLGCMRLVATRLDATRRLGGALAAAHEAALALAGGGHSPRIADGLAPLDAASLAQRLLAPWHAAVTSPARALEGVP
jgi:flagellar biosynthesis protein FlhF